MKNKNGSDNVYLYPTDTVWGMGTNIYSTKGHEKIIYLKGSRENKPFSILFSDIEQVMTFFNIPKKWNLGLLQNIFSLEVTLGFPKKWLKVEIPSWLTSDSPFVAFRCLNIPEVKHIIEKEGSPITTTSLNKSNEPPAIKFEEAKTFNDTHKGECVLVNFSLGKLSGNPSTIVFFQDEEKFEIKRIGKNIKEIESGLKLLST